MVVFFLTASNWNSIDLRVGGALAPWGGTGVGDVKHIQVLIDADGFENLVVHHAAYIKD
jgi:hypothetical protein